jgi:hypothetical protein
MRRALADMFGHNRSNGEHAVGGGEAGAGSTGDAGGAGGPGAAEDEDHAGDRA